MKNLPATIRGKLSGHINPGKDLFGIASRYVVVVQIQ